MGEINGKTGLYGLLGYPVEHTASPKMHNAAFDSLNMNSVYLPFPVKPECLEDAVAGLVPLGIKGVNVTIPHKQTIIPFVDSLHPSASAIGAVNTIQIANGKLIGYNTDAVGFASDVELSADFSFDKKTVYLCGSGGAGRAIAFACISRGVKKIGVYDLDSSCSKSLVDDLNNYVNNNNLSIQVDCLGDDFHTYLKTVNLAINATPIGMKEDDPIPFAVDCLMRDAIVYDVVYNIPKTALIKTAEKKNIKALNGLGMLLGQGAQAFRIWTGRAPDSLVMRRALEQAIYGDAR